MKGIFGLVILSAFIWRQNECSFELSECYGQVISLSCRAGYKMKIIDDFFGVSNRESGNDMCSHKDGDCVLVNNRETSVVHRYCEGKQSCTRFQVDRRPCGTNMTNYEHIEYECIKDSSITDICSPAKYQARHGYIATPNFPNKYPPDCDCQCTIKATSKYTRVQLESTYFSVKYDSPCKDYLELDMNGEKRKICGSYRETVLNQQFSLKFNSDEKHGHTGFWMYFSIYPSNVNATLNVECNQKNIPTTTPPTTTTTETTTTTTVTTTTKRPPKKKKPKPKDQDKKKETQPKSKDRDNKDKMTTKLKPKTTVKPTKTPKTKLKPKNYMTPKKTTKLTTVTTQTTTTKATTTTQPVGNAEDSNADLEESDPKTANRMTGIIIVCICVGGIVLLITILTILMCVSRSRRKPSKEAEKERKRRLEQRLNSLSFYDSIPLYESLRSGAVVPPPNGGVYNMGLDGDGLPECDYKHNSDWCSKSQDNEDSDADSAIYAELERQSRKSECAGTPRSTGTLRSKRSKDGGMGSSVGGSPRSPRNAKGLAGKGKKPGDQILSVNLKASDIDDVYTHV